jgi:hypothetical protein
MINLAAVSRLTAGELTRHFARPDVSIIPNAVDLARSNPSERFRRTSWHSHNSSLVFTRGLTCGARLEKMRRKP